MTHGSADCRNDLCRIPMIGVTDVLVSSAQVNIILRIEITNKPRLPLGLFLFQHGATRHSMQHENDDC